MRPNNGVVWYASPAAGSAPHTPDVRRESMKTIATALLAVLAIASGCATDGATTASISRNRQRFEKTTGALVIGSVVARDETHESILARVVTLAKQNDPSGIGVEIVVPRQYQQRYEHELKDRRATISLGPRLTMRQLMAEFPTDDWFLSYAGERMLRLMPVDSVRK